MAPLLYDTDLLDVSQHKSFSSFEFEAGEGNKDRGIGTYGLGDDKDKIDYLLLSPSLFERVTNGGIYRKGIWPGSHPVRWSTYETLETPQQAASDHHLLWADIDI